MQEESAARRQANLTGSDRPDDRGLARGFTVTHRLVLSIAVPMTLAYLSVPLVGLVDTGVIGQLGDAELIGGIAVGAIILDVVFTTFNFLRSGTTGLTAQAFGAGDRKEEQAVLVRALLIALVAGLAVIALQWPLTRLGILAMNVAPGVAEATAAYLFVRIWAAPFMLANYALIGWFLGIGRPFLVLGFQTVLALSNIGLSLYFVLGLGWGVKGVAGASVIAEMLTFLVSLPFVWPHVSGAARPSRKRVFDRQGFLRIAVVNRDIMIRSFSLLFAFAFFTRQGAALGSLVLAANALLMHFFLFAGYFLDGFATAAEQLVGRSVGARHRPAFDASVRLTLLWGFVLALGLATVYLLAGGPLIDLMTTSPELRETARRYLPWACLTPLAGVLAFQMDGVFIGATWSRDMRNMMLASLAVFVAACYALVPAFGNDGLWLALLLLLGLRGLTLSWRLPTRRAEVFGPAPAR
ncbi:MATE family efflux transporter [Afifella pfennigii]|uniref:MATE family efflux transporter n=1 Tax=Afifella pfennigii TaxID=209897 RepID=UPI000A04C116|nr:MATE family efflux transporter [Afifella pfennigii]